MLVDTGWAVSVVNPARIKGYAQGELARNKTDRADAALLPRCWRAFAPLCALPYERRHRRFVNYVAGWINYKLSKTCDSKKRNCLVFGIPPPGMFIGILPPHLAQQSPM